MVENLLKLMEIIHVPKKVSALNKLTYPKVLKSIGTPKIINFPFVSNGKLMILGVPLFKQVIKRLYSA